MIRALKILIPLLLIAVLLVVSAWFFLSYRPDLTSSFCLRQAQNAEVAGRSRSAIRWYRYAWSLTPNDSQIAIDLAGAYAQDGNYTKAEYTLVSAITNDPENSELYLELSRTYVAQDKLLDAEQMLSRTANENVRRQLNELRPASPQLSPETGEYTDLLDVSLSYSGGIACLALDGDFPSLEKDLYAGPVTLEEGETTAIAVTVSEDGLVSTPVSATYTIGGIIREISFQDAFVSRAVHEVLDKPAGDPIMSNELWGLATLTLPADTMDLSDLTSCKTLNELILNDASGVDLTVLSELTGLESLDLSGCTISNSVLSAISSLPQLKELKLSGCALTNVSALAPLTTLEVLDLSNNAIGDVDALQGMTALREVYLGTNTLSSISPLVALDNLELLDIASNRIATLAPLEGKTKLAALTASANKLTDVNVLSGCTALKLVDVSNNQISDLTPLSSLTELGTLLADHNTVEVLPDFSKATSLNRISLNYNSIPDLNGLKGLPYLNYVSMDYNRITDLSPLLECPTLVQVDAFANAVSGTVDELLKLDVIVNYDPTYEAPPEEDSTEDGNA